jgi:hypothetical protein
MHRSAGISILVLFALGLLLSACNGGITPDDLLWRRSSQARGRGVVYPLTVRHDSIILGGPPYSRFVLLDERTGDPRDTLDALENANSEILLIDRLPISYNGRESRMIIPVDASFIMDSLIVINRTPLLRGGPFTEFLLMRRRSDGEWKTLEFDLHEMHPNDIIPYKDRFLVLQYTTDHRSPQGYRYEVGLLDLRRESGS